MATPSHFLNQIKSFFKLKSRSPSSGKRMSRNAGVHSVFLKLFLSIHPKIEIIETIKEIIFQDNIYVDYDWFVGILSKLKNLS